MRRYLSVTFYIVIFVSSCFTLAACTSSAAIEKAKKTVQARMKDPESVQFKDLQFVANTKAVCGEFNAKNSYGAYVGFEDFVVDSSGNLHLVRKIQSNTDPIKVYDSDSVSVKLEKYNKMKQAKEEIEGRVADLMILKELCYPDK